MQYTIFIFNVFVLAHITTGLDPEHLWPLSPDIGGADVWGGVPALPVGCSVIAGETHPDLPYSGLAFSGITSVSYVDVTVSDTSAINDLSFTMFIYQTGDVTGTLLHMFNPNAPQMEIDRYPKKVLSEMILFGNETHLVLSLIGPNNADYGRVEIDNPIPLNTWYPLGFAHDASDGEVTFITWDQELFVQHKDTMLDDVYLGQPTTIRIGAPMQGDALSFIGTMTCVAIYDGKYSKSDMDKAIERCLPSKWEVKPTITPRKYTVGFNLTYM